MADHVLTFVTSLRHPQTTDSYEQCERLLSASIRSLAAQQDRRFRVIVVANTEFVASPMPDVQLDTVVVDFAAPDLPVAKAERHAAIKLDKGLKIAVGVSLVDDGHVMVFDSDDFISTRVTGFVADRADEKGWYVRRGWRYDVRGGLFSPQGHFDEVCGTSLIWRRNLLPHPGSLAHATPDRIIDAFGADTVIEGLGSHRFMRELYSLSPLPFRGALYAVNTGVNMSGMSELALGRPMTAAVAAEFGVQRPSPSVQWRAARAQLSPRRFRLLGWSAMDAVRTAWRRWRHARRSR